jgi:protein AFG1
MGSSDYLSLATHYDIFVITGIPPLGLTLRNEARRFITLIDTLYDSRKKVFFLAQKPPTELFDVQSVNKKSDMAAKRQLADDLNLSMDQVSFSKFCALEGQAKLF